SGTGPAESSQSGGQADYPVIALAGLDPDAAEPGTNQASVEITGTVTGPAPELISVQVALTTAGTATEGADYQALPATVTVDIPAGDTSASAIVDIIPLDDTETEPDETVEISITPAATYIVGPADSVTVTIADDEIDTDPPVVAITSPPDSESFDEGADIAVAADAYDPDGSIALVEFFEGANKLGQDSTAPYEFLWASPAAGAYTLSAVATDNLSVATTSETVTISVVANQPPSAAITSPSDGAQFTPGSSITISADAVDSDGNVILVEFYEGSTKLGEDNTAPWEFIWESPPGGTYSLTVVATDNDAAVSTSEPVSVSIGEIVISGPKLFGGMAGNIGGSWEMVPLPYSYDSMVVACTPVYDNTHAPCVVRIRNAAGTGFEMKVDNVDGTAVTPIDVYYLVAEQGVYTEAGDGITMEAATMLSTGTDYKGSWNGQPLSYGQAYSNPVVIGQVTSYNDSKWSVFWCHGNSSGNPPSSTDLYAGKAVGEDPDKIRTDETIGYFVFESGSWSQAGISLTAALGADNLQGMTNSPPYTYSHSLSTANGAVVSQAAMDGGDGAWAVLYGSNPVTSSSIAIALDEDMHSDSERGHTTEQAGYVVFDCAPVNILPIVSISSPLEGTAFKENADITVSADATDEDGSINLVEFYEGTAKIGEATAAPFEILWSNHPLGDYVLTAVATDDQGGSATSSPVSVSIVSNLPPDVTITSPSDAAAFDEGADVLIAASASDSDGSVEKVEFFTGALKLGEDFSEPYEYTLPAVEPGTHALHAVAFDDEGGSDTSDIVTIQVASTNPRLAGGVAPDVDGAWQTVTLSYSYASMVVVCTPNYDSGNKPAVVRIRNAGGSSFDVRIDATDAGTVTPVDVYYFVAQEGIYNSVEHGITMEAKTMLSTRTDENNSWTGEAISYSQDYANPVVLGQVMTYNDNRFSVFWSHDGSVTNPPSSTDIVVGKTVCEDDISVRLDEILGYIVLESGSYSVGNVNLETALGSDIIQGVTDSPPYSYSHGIAGPTGAVATLAAMDGNNGGWAVLYGSNPVALASINLAIDEDQEYDTERNHTSEQVGYVVFGITHTNEPPTVGLTSPLEGSMFDEGQDILITADATDIDGSITQVEFFQGAISLGTDSTAPYEITWHSPAPGTYALTAVATDDDASATTSAVVNMSVIANQAPSVSITSPADSASFTEGSDVTITADATDIDGSITQVEFFQGAISLGTDSTAPYEITWHSPAPGTYALTAVATDDDAAATTSAVVNMSVIANQAPSVSITSPADSASFTEGSDVTITADASDVDGSITQVEFFQGTTSLGTDSTAPYEITWHSPAPGAYALTAVATDDDAAATTSAVVNMSVIANQAPSVSIISPADSASFTEGSDVLITADASDTDGDVTLVEFYEGVNKLGEDNDAPFEYSWIAPDTGSWSITVVATDDDAAQTTSSAITITVATNDLPDVAVISPIDNTYITPRKELTITADAFDGDGSVDQVEFLADGISIGIDTAPPFEIAWQNVPMGTHSLTAVATDNLGGSTESAPITVTAEWRIMPIGNSITEGNGGDPTYRYFLWQDLITNGYSANLVGTNYGTKDGPSPYDFDQDHQGAWGIRSDEVQQLIGDQARASTPDIVLIHLGTNDIGYDNDIPGMTAEECARNTSIELMAIIDTLRSVNPDVVVFLAQIIPAYFDSWVVVLNDSIAAYGADKSTARSPVLVVDQHSALIYMDDFADGLHPNQFGQQKMGDTWFGAIQDYFALEPRITPAGGSFADSVTVEINSSAQNATVHYTLDGSVPTISSTSYTAPLYFEGDQSFTLSAKTFLDDSSDESAVITAAFTIAYDLTSPTVAHVTARNQNQVRIEFSEAITQASAENAVNYLIDNGITVLAASLQPENRSVILETDTLADGTTYTLTINDIIDRSINANAVAPNTEATFSLSEPPAGIFIEENGICVMEAEHYSAIDQRSDATNWALATAIAGYTDEGYMEVPEGTSGGDNTWETNCEISYDVQIQTPGTYYIAVRYRGPDGGSNSAKYGVDGTVISEGDFWNIISAFQWFHGATPLGHLGAGIHTIQIRRREDGWSVDRIMITTDPANFPDHGSTGTGPAENDRSGNQVPLVNITAPLDGAMFDSPADITITADASDDDGSIVNVAFYDGATLLGSDDTAPYEFFWSGVVTGTYSLTAKAFDDRGAETTSDPVSVTVLDNVPPAVSIIEPLDGSSFDARADIILTADAADIDGNVDLVEFYDGAHKLGDDAVAPFSLIWSGASDGVHELTAVAHDNQGKQTTSSTVTITVGSSGTGAFVEQNGMCVMEAEHFTSIDQRSDVTTWVEETQIIGYGGDGYMEIPDGTGGGDNTWEVNCEIAFEIQISTPGIYYLAGRYRAIDGGSNSAKYGLNGVEINDKDFWEVQSNWVWFHTYYPLGHLDAGTHTINIRRREDGFQLDRLMIAIDENDLPEHHTTEVGPAESPRM
ncbi:MAG: hypothetical protein GF350_11745, partial [Chitinivibrionales bacterium]|nr:hypothetical protein [Chitinivibrionales bacterium]